MVIPLFNGVKLATREGNMLNRRGFVGSVLSAVGMAKVLPAASVSRPTCVACGASWHQTSGCPINNAAMGSVSGIRFKGMSMQQCEVFLALHLPNQTFAEWGGQRVFPIVLNRAYMSEDESSDYAGDMVAYALPRWRFDQDQKPFPRPDSIQTVVTAWSI